MSKAVAAAVLRDFVDPCGKFVFVSRHLGVVFKAAQKILNAVEPERGTEKAGKNLSLCDRADYIRARDLAVFVKAVEQTFIAKRERFKKFIGIFLAEIHTVFAEPCAKIFRDSRLVRAAEIHFVHKNKARNVVAREQLPQGFGVALNSVGAADNEYGVVEHLQGALGLGRKIDVAGSVEQSKFGIAEAKDRLL